LLPKAGADPLKVRQALDGGLAPAHLEVHGERMIKRNLRSRFFSALSCTKMTSISRL